MSRGRSWWSWLLGGGLILAMGVLAVWVLLVEQERLRYVTVAQDLRWQAETLRDVVQLHWGDFNNPSITAVTQRLQANRALCAIVAADGTVLRDAPRGAVPRDLKSRPEMQAATRDGVAEQTARWGATDETYVFAAARVDRAADTVGYVWLAAPQRSILHDGATVARVTLLVGGVAVLVAAALRIVIVRARRRTFDRVIATVRQLSSGDLTGIAPLSGADELEVLTHTLDSLRGRMLSQVELIERQRSMLEALVNQLSEGVIVARADGRIALINPAAVRLLALHVQPAAHETLIDEPVEACIPQHALQELLAPLTSIGGERGGRMPDERLEVQTPSGSIHLLARGSTLLLADGQAETPEAGRVVVLTDITELQRTIQVRTDFVANASHELRTPLSTIRAAIETLLGMDLVTEGPAAQQFLRKVDRHSARLEQMVADLLDLSHLESPTERFEPEAVEIRKLAQEIHGRFADALERKNLGWSVEVEPPSAVTLVVNPRLVRLALDNLVDNAVRYTDAGGTVRLRIQVGRPEAWLEVSDTGCGIPPEDQQRVFERFYQVQRSRSGPDRGTGLGLSIVRHAVGALKGRVELSSTPGQGTTVRFSVPQP